VVEGTEGGESLRAEWKKGKVKRVKGVKKRKGKG
jgi:hypothetical protein